MAKSDEYARCACRRERCDSSTSIAWRRSARSATSIMKTSSIGKAGRNRHRGRRPTVRGSAMNPRDHPHGGGEGKAPIGGQPKTPWGKPDEAPDPPQHKATDSMIVRRRRSEGRRRQFVSRSSKKGPFIDAQIAEGSTRSIAPTSEAGDPHLGTSVNDLPWHGRAYSGGTQREGPRADLRVRADGRAQARRVRADANVPWPRRRPVTGLKK